MYMKKSGRRKVVCAITLDAEGVSLVGGLCVTSINTVQPKKKKEEEKNLNDGNGCGSS